jgi:glucose-1-phosphatase
MIEAVRESMPCFAFTNTNAVHMETWSGRFPGVVSAFDRIFASYQIGLRKPERAAFEHVCQSIGIPPAEVMFFDDSRENVEAARNAGMQAVLVRSPDDVRAALRELGHAI